MSSEEHFEETNQDAIAATHSELPTKPVTEKKHASMAKGNVCPGVAQAALDKAGMTRETYSILRVRMKAASWILFATFASFLIKALVGGVLLETWYQQATLWMHVAVTFIAGFTAIRLSTQCRFVVGNLRSFELLLFGSSAIFLCLAQFTMLMQDAAAGVPASQMTTGWLLLIFNYALFIPNHWKRAVSVIVPLSMLCPLVYMLGHQLSPQSSSIEIPSAVGGKAIIETWMVMTIGAAVASWGAYYNQFLRKQTFEAKQLNQYQLKEKLGSGGMGDVYLAEHKMLKRPCAMKLIKPDRAGDERTLSRFELEVQKTAQLSHWNTIEIFDYGRAEDGTFYYVMELLPGKNLDDLVRDHGPLPFGRAIYLLAQACDALSEAHELDLIHRDIKPANIFVSKRGGFWDVVKLLDFGLVKSAKKNDDSKITQQGMVVGSPAFMAPEQGLGEVTDSRSDIYSLGVTAYFLISGKILFENSNPIQVIMAHAHQKPTPLSAVNPNVPADLEAVIGKCLEKDPDNRYQTALELREALLACESAGSWTREDADAWWRKPVKPMSEDEVVVADEMAETMLTTV